MLSCIIHLYLSRQRQTCSAYLQFTQAHPKAEFIPSLPEKIQKAVWQFHVLLAGSYPCVTPTRLFCT